MATTKETIWSRLIKLAFKTPELKHRPPPDLDANTRVLMMLRDNDPVYNMLLDHAFSEYSNNLLVAMDPREPVERRIRYLDRAAGVGSFLDDIEARRTILRDNWKKQQRLPPE